MSTGDAKAQCTREVEPESHPGFSGDRCDGQYDVGFCLLLSVVEPAEWLGSVSLRRRLSQSISVTVY